MLVDMTRRVVAVLAYRGGQRIRSVNRGCMIQPPDKQRKAVGAMLLARMRDAKLWSFVWFVMASTVGVAGNDTLNTRWVDEGGVTGKRKRVGEGGEIHGVGLANVKLRPILKGRD